MSVPKQLQGFYVYCLYPKYLRTRPCDWRNHVVMSQWHAIVQSWGTHCHKIWYVTLNILINNEELSGYCVSIGVGTHSARQNAAYWGVASPLPRAFLALTGVIVFELVDNLLILEWARAWTLWKVSFFFFKLQVNSVITSAFCGTPWL